MKTIRCPDNVSFTIEPQTYEHWSKKIETMSHEDLAKLYRFAPSGHIVFSDTRLHEQFVKRFYKLFGGMTSEMSKRISGS